MAKQEIKEPVKLRQKTLANGNASLYLDIYHNGRRTYEFLKLYIIPEKTRADKEKNRETLKLANSVKAQRIIEIQNLFRRTDPVFSIITVR
ncbi:MAG: Arm DNA-binding domain-containing protein [Lachnoclostridium sp.]|nr:Arm DNA-binding domain-containing protein [Lachnoclostridium sp.]